MTASHTASKTVRRFFKRAGLITSSEVKDAVRDQLAKEWGRQCFLDADAATKRASSTGDKPYAYVWANLGTVRYYFRLVSQITEAWLGFLSERSDLGPQILDIGTGAGVPACYLAQRNPDWKITGIDPSSHGIARARELSEELQIGNTEFHTMNLQRASNSTTEKYNSAIASYALRELANPLEMITDSELDSWSHMAGYKHLVTSSRIPAVEPIAAVLKEGGSFFWADKFSSFYEVACLVGALAGAGLRSTSFKIIELVLPDKTENAIPFGVAVRQSGISRMTTWNGLKSSFWLQEPLEYLLATDPPTRRLGGSELEIRTNTSSRWFTRYECVELKSGAIVGMITTMKGDYEFQVFPADERSGVLHRITEAAEFQASEDPDVSASHPLTDEPVPQSRPDLLD